MRSTIFTLLFCLAIVPLWAQESVSVKQTPKQEFEKIDSKELVKRYPIGKKWQSLSVFRVNGRGSSQNWGLTGECQFLQANRYQTQVEVLENNQFGQTSTIRLRCDVIDASSSRIVTKKTLRLAEFGSSDPLIDFVGRKAVNTAELISPQFQAALAVLRKWEEIDPKYQRTLTGLANRLGVQSTSFGKDKNLRWMETPRVYSGCSFEVQWVNGTGVTDAKQIKNSVTGAKMLSESDLRSWLCGADPLAEIYVFPSLDKKVGDSWKLDASRATSIFAGQGDATSSGNINLSYESDGEYNENPVRNVYIKNGNVKVTTTSEGHETRYKINSMQGAMKVDNRDAMLQMSHGTGEVGYSRMSTDHFLFKAELRRDISCEWRYEAERMNP